MQNWVASLLWVSDSSGIKLLILWPRNQRMIEGLRFQNLLKGCFLVFTDIRTFHRALLSRDCHFLIVPLGLRLGTKSFSDRLWEALCYSDQSNEDVGDDGGSNDGSDDSSDQMLMTMAVFSLD